MPTLFSFNAASNAKSPPQTLFILLSQLSAKTPFISGLRRRRMAALESTYPDSQCANDTDLSETAGPKYSGFEESKRGRKAIRLDQKTYKSVSMNTYHFASSRSSNASSTI